MKIYRYNTGSKVLHLLNGCKDAKSATEEFDSESDAVIKYPMQVIWCKKCMEKREEILRKALEEKK